MSHWICRPSITASVTRAMRSTGASGAQVPSSCACRRPATSTSAAWRWWPRSHSCPGCSASMASPAMAVNSRTNGSRRVLCSTSRTRRSRTSHPCGSSAAPRDAMSCSSRRASTPASSSSLDGKWWRRPVWLSPAASATLTMEVARKPLSAKRSAAAARMRSRVCAVSPPRGRPRPRREGRGCCWAVLATARGYAAWGRLLEPGRAGVRPRRRSCPGSSGLGSSGAAVRPGAAGDGCRRGPGRPAARRRPPGAPTGWPRCPSGATAARRSRP